MRRGLGRPSRRARGSLRGHRGLGYRHGQRRPPCRPRGRRLTDGRLPPPPDLYANGYRHIIKRLFLRYVGVEGLQVRGPHHQVLQRPVGFCYPGFLDGARARRTDVDKVVHDGEVARVARLGEECP